MRFKAFCFALVLAATVSPGFAQNPKYIQNLEKLINRADDASVGEEDESDPDDVLIESELNAVGVAFENGDASQLEDCLVRGKRKVFLSLAAGEKEPDHYGTSQLRFIFDEIFQEVRTRSFVYDSHDIERYNGIAIARADWTYTVVTKDDVVTEHVQFKLQKDETSWRVFEIRATTR